MASDRANGLSHSCQRARPSARQSLDDSPTHLIQLNGLEERLEITFTETFVAFALNDLEEDRTDDVLREDLQQHPFPFLGVAVDQDAPLAQLFDWLAVSGHTSIDALVVRIRRFLELHAVLS